MTYFPIYPKQLRNIAGIIEGLDHLPGGEEDDGGIFLGQNLPLTDGDGVDWGHLRDDIGGTWSWHPPGTDLGL